MSSPFAIDPGTLAEARMLCHVACQWPSKAARANLAAEEDDSHSNLGWRSEHAGLLSRFLDDGRRYQLGFSFSSGALIWLVADEVAGRLALRHETEASAKDWVDGQLAEVSLNSTDHAVMPYALEYEAPYAAALPSLPEPLFWNREGFVSVILRSSDIDENMDLGQLLDIAFATARGMI